MLTLFYGPCLDFVSDVFSSGNSTKSLYIFLITFIRATCPTHFIYIHILFKRTAVLDADKTMSNELLLHFCLRHQVL